MSGPDSDHGHEDRSDEPLSLLNIYEVETEGGTEHWVGFQDPVLAGVIGVQSHAMVGDFTPGPDGDFDPETFDVNPEFLEVVTAYMNLQPAQLPEMAENAKQIPGQPLYVVDPRNDTPLDEDPPAEDVLGHFQVDEHGTIVPNSFEYNTDHTWFSTEAGVSGMLADRRFYAWLHPQAHGIKPETPAEPEA